MKHIGLSEDEIIRDWSLHAGDLVFVALLQRDLVLFQQADLDNF